MYPLKENLVVSPKSTKILPMLAVTIVFCSACSPAKKVSKAIPSSVPSEGETTETLDFSGTNENSKTRSSPHLSIDDESTDLATSPQHEELQAEFEAIASDIGDVNSNVRNLREELDEIFQHKGDVSSAEIHSGDIVQQCSDIEDRLDRLISNANEVNDSEIEQKAETSKASMELLHRSISELHDNLGTAEVDPFYRHHEGITDLSNNMDEAEDCPGYDSLDQRPGLLSSASKYRLSISSVAPIVVALDLNYI